MGEARRKFEIADAAKKVIADQAREAKAAEPQPPPAKQLNPACPYCHEDLLNISIQARPLPDGRAGIVLFCGNEKCRAFLQIMPVNIPQRTSGLVGPTGAPLPFIKQ